MFAQSRRSSVLAPLFGSRRGRSANVRRRSPRLNVEGLEDRSVPSAAPLTWTMPANFPANTELFLTVANKQVEIVEQAEETYTEYIISHNQVTVVETFTVLDTLTSGTVLASQPVSATSAINITSRAKSGTPILVEGTPRGIPTTINLKNSGDAVTVGDSSGLQHIQGQLTIHGTGSNTLTLNDSGDSGKRSAALSGNSLTGLAPATIGFSAVGALDVSGSLGVGSSYFISGSPCTTNLVDGGNYNVVNVDSTRGTVVVVCRGSDTVSLFGNPRVANTLKANPTSASLSGTGYSDAVSGFATANAYSTNAADTAQLSGSSSSGVASTFVVSVPNHTVTMTSAINSVSVYGFHTVTDKATNANDVMQIDGAPNGNYNLTKGANGVTLSTSGYAYTGLAFTAANFAVINADSVTSLSTTVGYARGYSAQYLQTGSAVTIYGSGFTTATKVQFGATGTNQMIDPNLLTAPAAVDPDGKWMTVDVPSDAVSGPLFVSFADGTILQPSQTFTVHSYRDTFGFSFPNPVLHVDRQMLENEFGTAQMGAASAWQWFVDPAGAAAHDAFAAAFLSVVKRWVNGACEGMSEVSSLMASNPSMIDAANGLPAGAAPTVFDLQSNSALTNLIDAKEVGQFSVQMGLIVLSWLKSSHTANSVYDQVNGALQEGQHPLIPMVAGANHCVVAYDLEPGPKGNGDYYIDVYDPNRPANFVLNDGEQQLASRIYVNGNSWTFTMAGAGPQTYSGGWGTLFVISPSVLAGRVTAGNLSPPFESLVFGSAGNTTAALPRTPQTPTGGADTPWTACQAPAMQTIPARQTEAYGASITDKTGADRAETSEIADLVWANQDAGSEPLLKARGHQHRLLAAQLRSSGMPPI